MSNDRFKGEGIFASGYGMISKQVMNDPELTIEAKAIYAYLASYSGAGDTAYPSVSLMCGKLNISESRFYRHRKLLEEKGYIIIEQTRSDTGWLNNIYRLPSKPTPQNEGTGDKPTPQNECTQNEGTQNECTQNGGTISNSSKSNSSKSNSLINNHPPLVNKKSDLKRLEADFDRFWQIYPRKIAKKKAREDWIKKHKPSAELAEQIINAVEQQKRTIWKNEDPQYIPHATTWLNQGRWEDEIPKQRTHVGNYTVSERAERQVDEFLVEMEATKGMTNAERSRYAYQKKLEREKANAHV